MRQFLKTGLIIFTILSLPIFVELFLLPQDLFNFRIWESIIVHSYPNHFYGTFYPNEKVTKIVEGDLGHHTIHGIPKEVTMITDSLGFRNKQFIKKPDMLFIGDSQTLGSQSDQKDILSEVIAQKTGLSTYNMAPTGFGSYLSLLEKGIIEQPKVIVYQTVENKIKLSSLEEQFDKDPADFYYKHGLTGLPKLADRIHKSSMKNYINARISGVGGLGIASPIKEGFLHLPFQTANKDIDGIVATLKDYKKYFNEQGIEFMFIVVPDKANIYHEWVPAVKEQSPILKKLYERLIAEGIYTVDLLTLFNQKKAEGAMLYYFDDTHWNHLGISVAAEALSNLIKKEAIASK